VIDYAGVLSAAERDRLETTLRDVEQRTRAQMVVAIFASLEGENLDQFALRLANAWEIGRKGVYDGVVLVVFMKDRWMRLEIGSGLESTISNSEAENILRNLVAPRFRSGDYYTGLEEAAREVLYRIEEAQRTGKLAR
jgi:uncharacterized protein